MKTIEISDDSYRKSTEDFIHFNSDLNKFIHNEIPTRFTIIDCDLLEFKKADNVMKNLRIGEYKHENEPMGIMQKELLNEIANIFAFAMNNGYKRKYPENYLIKLECVILVGNPPFNRLFVQNLTQGYTILIEGQELVKKYLAMEDFTEDDKKNIKLVDNIYFGLSNNKKCNNRLI